MKRLLLDKNLTDGAKIFYQTLWLFYGKECNATHEELSQLFGKSVRGIHYFLAELKKHGWVFIGYTNEKNHSGRHIVLTYDLFADLDSQNLPARVSPANLSNSSAILRNSPADNHDLSANLRTPININELVYSESISSEDSESVVESKNESESCKKENKEKKPTKKENKEAHAKELLTSLALPSSLDPDLWNTFIAHRAEIKKPLKAVGKSRMIHRLLDLEAQGIDINEAIETSIRNGWQDVFAPKPSSKPKAKDEFSHLEPMELTEKILKELQAQYPDSHRVFAIDCKKEFYAFGRRVESYSRENSRLLRFARS